MIRNYFKTAIRNLWKDKQHAFINIVGLSLGMMVAIFIMAYVYHEVKVDQKIENAEQISRVYRQWGESKMLINPTPLAAAIREEIDGAVSATTFRYMDEALMVVAQQSHFVNKVAIADSAFFEVFNWSFIHGESASAFDQINTIVLTRSMAEKLFNTSQAIGKTLRFNDELLCTVSGVVEPFAGESHLNFSMIANIDVGQTSWSGAAGMVYLQKNPSTDIGSLEAQITQMANNYVRMHYQEDGERVEESDLPEWKLQPLADVHLYSGNMRGNFFPGGDIRQVRLLSGLALIVLLLAGINYVNLATARSGKRIKEVGLRKVMGATRTQIRMQFLVESVLQSLLALLFAVGMAEACMPVFNKLVDRGLSLLSVLDTPFPLYLLLLALATGLLSGLYPAFYLEQQQPVHTIKGQTNAGREKSYFRKALVVFQFTLSAALVTFIAIIWQQMQYITSQELGFSGDQVVVAEINTEEGMARVQQRKVALEALPGVVSVSQMARVPGDYIPDYGLELENREERISAMMFFVDENFDQVLDIQLTDGRFFDRAIPSDSAAAFVVNEAFVRAFGGAAALGKRLRFPYEGEKFGEIVGVVKDFHYNSLEQAVGPAVLSMRSDLSWMGKVAMKLDGQQIGTSIGALEAFWKQVEPAHPLRYDFLDAHFSQQYERFYRLQETVFYTSLLSIIVAILGLFGLASFMAEQRTKEISVRKVLGASVRQLTSLLVGAHIRLVLIAGLIAVPLAFYLAHRWLQNFAHHIELGPWPFLLVLAGILLLAILTVGIKAIRVAIANPADHLKYE
jgi:putative ABC transport system permease protein